METVREIGGGELAVIDIEVSAMDASLESDFSSSPDIGDAHRAYVAVMERARRLHLLCKQVGLYWDGPIVAANKIHKDLLEKRNAWVARIKTVEDKYVLAGERIAQAEKKAQEERERSEREEREQMDRLGVALRLEAGIEQEILPQPEGAVEAEAAPAAYIAPKVEGTYTVEEWKYEIVNQLLIPDLYWRIDATAIAACVRQNKSLSAQMLGGDGAVRVWAEQRIRYRSS